MRSATIKAICYLIAMLFLLLQGCGVLFFREEDERIKQEAQFAPYQQKNTIEAYREFIQKYPDNMFVNSAKGSIENLEFSSYEQKDTIEGYREFQKNFPANRNISRAAERIEQLTFNQIEDADTIIAYREFLQKNPHSNYTMLAQQRLQELEFIALDKTCQDKYGFDLLLYRLNVTRLQKELEPIDVSNLADFKLFASLDNNADNRCFKTHLIYGGAIVPPDAKTKKSPELYFNFIITKLLVYLDKKFAVKKELDGFCFAIASSSNRFYGDAAVLFTYYFPAESVHQFAEGVLGPGELLARASVRTPAITTQVEKAAVSQPSPPH